jgi:CBS domain-containing protein
MKIKNILATKGANVVTIGPEQSLGTAVDLLSRHNIGALAVIDTGNQLVGIISERDIIRTLARREDVLSRTVGEVMTRSVLTGSPQEDVKSVLQTMSAKKIRHLLILEEGNLAGMISIRDIIQIQLDSYEGKIETLEIMLGGEG